MLLFNSAVGFGQRYIIYPNDTLIVSAPKNVLSHFTIQQNNLTNEKLILRWSKVISIVTPGWEVSLCDNGHCYTNCPDFGSMDTVFSGEYGLMSMAVNPGSIPGSAIVQYLVWDAGDTLNKDTLTWIISEEATNTGIDKALEQLTINAYPNPTSSKLLLGLKSDDSYNYLITDYAGRVYKNGGNLSGNCEISISEIPDGNYVLMILNENEILRKRITISH